VPVRLGLRSVALLVVLASPAAFFVLPGLGFGVSRNGSLVVVSFVLVFAIFLGASRALWCVPLRRAAMHAVPAFVAMAVALIGALVVGGFVARARPLRLG
jgi:hypothetical protein